MNVSGSAPSDAVANRPTALVITVSTRAAAGVYPDSAGPLLVEGLTELGCATDGPTVVPDGDERTGPLADALASGIADGYDLIVTSGGTGITPTDRTPEVTAPLLDFEVPGIAERLRTHGVENGVPTAMLSRGRVGVAGSTLVVNLAGSRGAARDGLAVLGAVLPHALDQVAGGDHR